MKNENLFATYTENRFFYIYIIFIIRTIITALLKYLATIHDVYGQY